VVLPLLKVANGNKTALDFPLPFSVTKPHPRCGYKAALHATRIIGSMGIPFSFQTEFLVPCHIMNKAIPTGAEMTPEFSMPPARLSNGFSFHQRFYPSDILSCRRQPLSRTSSGGDNRFDVIEKCISISYNEIIQAAFCASLKLPLTGKIFL